MTPAGPALSALSPVFGGRPARRCGGVGRLWSDECALSLLSSDLRSARGRRRRGRPPPPRRDARDDRDVHRGRARVGGVTRHPSVGTCRPDAGPCAPTPAAGQLPVRHSLVA
eukprot:6469662-Prymnesium_polylepis.2